MKASNVDMRIRSVRLEMMRTFLSTLLLVLFFGLGPQQSFAADDMHEFITSCSYGVIAGSLVGVASLAFEKQPGKSLNNVARGASLGLYAGIILGIYAIYFVPGENERDFNRVSIGPTFGPQARIDGVQGQFRVLDF